MYMQMHEIDGLGNLGFKWSDLDPFKKTRKKSRKKERRRLQRSGQMSRIATRARAIRAAAEEREAMLTHVAQQRAAREAAAIRAELEMEELETAAVSGKKKGFFGTIFSWFGF